MAQVCPNVLYLRSGVPRRADVPGEPGVRTNLADQISPSEPTIIAG
jgi:hypothetical protein